MSKHPRWSQEDEAYLAENWGTLAIATLAKNLGRTETGIVIRARRLNLGPFLDSGDYISLNQLITTVTGSKGTYNYKIKSWVQNRGFPIHYKRVGNCRRRIVYLKEFWEWAEKNRSFLDFSKMEPLALGKEPEWVLEQRKKDFDSFPLQYKKPWTSEEDSRLIMLVKQQRYGYAELSEILQRSTGAIQSRLNNLGVKDRPIKADNHGPRAAWTQKDLDALADGIRHGVSYAKIGQAIGKSEKAVRGKAFYQYLTEDADKIRAMLGGGTWGHGAPEPTVKQGLKLSRTVTSVRKDLSALIGLLQYRIHNLGYDPYWQRFLCAHWSGLHGCMAGCSDCDSCAEFLRISPQYCARCGKTFFERQKNHFCESCRMARKKQAQRKWKRKNCAPKKRERGK